MVEVTGDLFGDGKRRVDLCAFVNNYVSDTVADELPNIVESVVSAYNEGKEEKVDPAEVSEYVDVDSLSRYLEGLISQVQQIVLVHLAGVIKIGGYISTAASLKKSSIGIFDGGGDSIPVTMHVNGYALAEELKGAGIDTLDVADTADKEECLVAALSEIFSRDKQDVFFIDFLKEQGSDLPRTATEDIKFLAPYSDIN